ncbi:MAG: sirohydrochlorin chelatase [Ottowia sp.]
MNAHPPAPHPPAPHGDCQDRQDCQSQTAPAHEHAHAHAPQSVHHAAPRPVAAVQPEGEVILVIGHGSRQEEGNRQVREFVARWRERRPGWRVEVGFIEFGRPDLHDALLAAGRSARRVLALPLILNAAGHVRGDIPAAVAHARQHCPDVEFLVAPHLSACQPILDVLLRRLDEALQSLDMPDPSTTGVILLGRGSSDPLANGDMARMARWLFEAAPEHELVDLAFTGVTWPRLEKVVQRHARLGMGQIVVLPHYLYTGVLIERIQRQVEHLRVQHPRMRFACAPYFGFEPEIFALLEHYVSELRERGHCLPLDGSGPRPVVPGHHHGHDHHHHDHHHHQEPTP